MRGLVIGVGLLLAAASARADTRRIAVVVGNNTGNDGTPPLRFAETDADKFAQVLGDLGDVGQADLYVLRGRSLAALGETFSHVRRRIAELRSHPATRIVVVFYFSGHSDGLALELGRDRFAYTELRRELAELGADVRLAVIDSCKSGGLLEIKGGVPAAPFQIRMTDELASTGEVLLTSSAANEIALESSEIAGSFFTHHLVSGLRGAADSSGDGQVTLTEAYHYAYSHTIKTTGATVLGAQHPAYDYRLSGQGELVLSQLGRRTAILEMPAGFDRIVVSDADRGQILAEVSSDGHARIAVHPGRYAIRASRDGKLFAADVAAVDGGLRVVRGDELTAVQTWPTRSKGALAGTEPWLLMAAGGVSDAVAASLGPMPRARLELATPRGLSIAVDGSSRRGNGFRESSLRALAGMRWARSSGGWSTWVGVAVGGGVVMQSMRRDLAYSGMVSAGGIGGLSLALSRRLAIAGEVDLSAELIKRDGHAALLIVPTGWLGLVMSLH